MRATARSAPREADVAAAWAAGARGPLRLEDGRPLAVVFPGIPGGSAGPDFRDAILDAGGDLLRGDVEVHLRASGWRAHGHDRDPAYAGVVLHVVAENDTGARTTIHAGARALPVLVLPPPAAPGFPPPFTPPCALRTAAGADPGPVLLRLGERRLRSKAARLAPAIAAHGTGQALYGALLETLAGPPNREAFARAARAVPLAALLADVEDLTASRRAAAITAFLGGHLPAASLARSGLRPAAAPGRRLAAAGVLVARLWPRAGPPDWPASLEPGLSPATLQAPGHIGRALALELLVNAVLPAALAAGIWDAGRVAATFRRLPGPGTYGRLKPLEGWLAPAGRCAFSGAASLQGGLLLHADYCSRGRCGRCPLS